MTPVELLLTKLPGAKRNGTGWSARCPAHDDAHPSLSVSEGDGGRALVRCHAGCPAETIVGALKLRMSDLMPTNDGNGVGAEHAPPRQSPAPTYSTAREAAAALVAKHGPLVGKWYYRDAQGNPVGLVLRWNDASGNKVIRPISLVNMEMVGAWLIGGMPTPRPLYNLPTLLARPDDRVYVVEGEKTADAAATLGLLTTTSAHGSNGAAGTDWRPLGGREVVLVPDNDVPGDKYARDVAGLLAKLSPAPTVRTIRLTDGWPDLPTGGDLVDIVTTDADRGEIVTKLEALIAAAETPAQPGPVLIRMSDVEPREVSWLWPGRIPLGRITLLVGRPGEGKSFITIDAAARVTTGTPWPDRAECPRGSVILISAEDDPHDTIRPRLDAHRADVGKVHLLSMVRRVGADGQPYEAMFTLADLPALEQALQTLPDCKLIIIDPIGSFLGGSTDAHRDNEVRSVLAPVAALAEKHRVAVVVVAHRRKASGACADDLALGSRAFTGIARAVWHLSRDPDSKGRRLLLPGKNNLAVEGDGLAFTIEGDPARLGWERDPVARSADDALVAENECARKPGPAPAARDKAAEWLRDLLASGPLETCAIKTEGLEAGYSWRTLHRAKDELGIQPYRERFSSAYLWKLPDQPDPDPASVPSCSLRENNLASWHTSKITAENSDFELGTLGATEGELGTLGAPAWLDPTDAGTLPRGVVELARERPGWTPGSWQRRLLELADKCADGHPQQAAEYRQAAAIIGGT